MKQVTLKIEQKVNKFKNHETRYGKLIATILNENGSVLTIKEFETIDDIDAIHDWVDENL